MSTEAYVDRIANYLKRRRYQWIRAERLMQIGGICGWRTRVSNARRRYDLPITNRLRRQGKRVISEYRLGRRKAA